MSEKGGVKGPAIEETRALSAPLLAINVLGARRPDASQRGRTTPESLAGNVPPNELTQCLDVASLRALRPYPCMRYTLGKQDDPNA